MFKSRSHDQSNIERIKSKDSVVKNVNEPCEESKFLRVGIVEKKTEKSNERLILNVPSLFV